MSFSSKSVREEELHAYVDGRLDADRRLAVEAWLVEHPDAAGRVAAYRQQNSLLASFYDPVLEEPIPPRLQAQAIKKSRRFVYLPVATAAAAAWLFIGAAGGWMLHAYQSEQTPAPGLATLPQRAAIAHVVYTPEVLHPVEVGAEQEAHLANWLSKRLGAALQVPQLQAMGYDLVGGRLLPDQDRPAAQFMYQDAGGRRLTLYVRTQEASDSATAFRYSMQDGVAVFYWIDGAIGYALSGDMDKTRLLQAAEVVYRELNL